MKLKKVNKVLSITLASAMLVSSVPVNTFADEAESELATEQAEKKEATRSSYRPIRTGAVATEVNVIGMTGAEAMPVVERFLDQALAAGFSPVRIIHGKGSGALRKAIHAFLDRQPFVTSYRLDDAQNGGDGVTLVYF